MYINSEPVLLINPYLGPTTGGTSLTILIKDPDLLPDDIWSTNDMATCYFGTSIVSATRGNTAGALKCTSPANPKSGYIQIYVSLNGQDKIPTQQNFFYYDDPVIESISPAFAPRGERNYLTLRGRNFYNTQLLSVKFGETQMNGIWVSSEEIRVLAPIEESASSEVVRLPVFVSHNPVPDRTHTRIRQAWD